MTTQSKTIFEDFGKLYCDEEVFKTMPPAQNLPIEFFTIGKYVSNDELGKEYESRGLMPASPYDLAEFHQRNPDFAEVHRYTSTQWMNEDGKWCFATFFRWVDERGVGIFRHDIGWGDYWWFAGVRKGSVSSEPLSTLPSVLVINGVKYKKI